MKHSEVVKLNKVVWEKTPEELILRTENYWKLWVETSVGGIARYTNDFYHRVGNDTEHVPGNPWFICTMWLAEYDIMRANNLTELNKALPILEWVVDRALASGALAEQIDPYTNEPLSVSPLT